MAAQPPQQAPLSDEQGGFRSGRGCIDQLFILTEVLRLRHNQGKATFVCFIDVKKAYDTVFRDGLWKRLLDVGLSGRILRVLLNLYDKAESAVMVNGILSRWFESGVGVRQGCVLSPLLFSIFINPLIEELRATGAGIDFDGGELLS